MTSGVGKRIQTTCREIRMYSKDASSTNSERSETYPRPDRLLQEVCTTIHWYFETPHQAHMTKCQLWLDRTVPKVIQSLTWTLDGVPNSMLSGSCSWLHTLHRCKQNWMVWSVNTGTHGWQREDKKSPFLLCQWPVPWKSVNLGSSDKGSICNLHIN